MGGITLFGLLKGYGWFLVLLFGGFAAQAQITPEWYAQNRMEKGKWGKAEQSIKKALRKDSLPTEANYIYARWYFSTQNPKYDLDSAYAYTLLALQNYSASSTRLKEKLKRVPLDSTHLILFRERVDSAAYVRAKEVNTEAGYNEYLARFVYAHDREKAVELRDEVSFLDALKINTYESFLAYLNRYPKSHRAEEARKRYEKLLFEDKTKDGKLKSFISFYKDYPASPYRGRVEKTIFEIATASGEPSAYLEFIQSYPANPWVKAAGNLLYHIETALGMAIPHQIQSDSLKRITTLEEGYWVPFLKNGRFGFMNERGDEIIEAKFTSVPNAYLCGNITEDYLITSSGVISRSGKLIYTGAVNEAEDLGFGFLLIKSKSCNAVIHKSGITLIKGCFEDAKIVGNHFLALQKGSKWGLFAFNGKEVLGFEYEDIESENEIIILVKNKKRILNTIEQIAAAADGNAIPEKLVFDEVRKLSSELLLVKNGALEGVLNDKLDFVIKLDRQVLLLTSFGFVKKTLNKVSTVGVSAAIDNEAYTDIKPYLNWLGLFRPGDIKLFHLPSSKIIGTNLDSLWFTNRLALGLKKDSLRVYFNSGKRMVFPASARVSFIKSPDSVRYFYLEEKNKKQVYEVDSGTKLFASEFESIEYLGYNIFMLTKAGKRGLISTDGKPILPVEYDALIRSSDQVVSLLKDKKFGLFNLPTQKLIKPAFERNLTIFNQSVLVAFKEGYYGFIDRESKPISEFEFEEVKPWSDSCAFVKKDFRWMLYNIYTQAITQKGIKDYTLFKDEADEKIALIHKENDYGVLSSTKGMIIPPTFSDILNLGTAERPFYFTEKNVEEADIFVVLYYDQKGKMIRRQIYEAEEYDRIYCQ